MLSLKKTIAKTIAKPTPARQFYTLQRRAWVLLVVIGLFTLAQIGWWLIFLQHSIEDQRQTTISAWKNQATAAQTILELTPLQQQPAIRQALAAQYPQLDVLATPVQIHPKVLAEFEAKQQARVRMLVFEGPFFMLVLFWLLWLVGQSLKHALELRRRQQNFLLSTTHEVRTPLSTLRLLLDTALLRPLSAEQHRQYLERMSSELNRLERLSERILAAARLGQQLDISRRVQDIRVVVEQYVAHNRAELEAQGAVLHLNFGPAPQPELTAAIDDQGFAVVLSNLLENAIKYNPNPRKNIFISGKSQTNMRANMRANMQENMVVLTVEDDGVGIQAAETEVIFEQFYRSGSEQTRNTAGLGLGLFLVRGIIEGLGGSVRAEATAGGARFVLRLPAAATNRAGAYQDGVHPGSSRSAP
jgi:signal transduction histidine kinase